MLYKLYDLRIFSNILEPGRTISIVYLSLILIPNRLCSTMKNAFFCGAAFRSLGTSIATNVLKNENHIVLIRYDCFFEY